MGKGEKIVEKKGRRQNDCAYQKKWLWMYELRSILRFGCFKLFQVHWQLVQYEERDLLPKMMRTIMCTKTKLNR